MAPLEFKVIAQEKRARASVLTLPHGDVQTPVFMPVGTQGSIKGLTSEQMESIGCKILLANTYHLALRPGTDLIDDMGGMHSLMNWKNNMLTDSGGFQMVSLLELAEITEEGVTFQSPVDGSRMLLTPEMSIQHQNRIGADIIMALDDVAPSTINDPARFKEACHRTLRWIDRCIAAHTKPDSQNLFGIVQGGLDTSPGGLRDICIEGLVSRNLPGYAIGGLAGGECKDAFWRVVSKCAASLPANKPRYLMGVGYPVDLVVCSALGVDMYDCVYPTRTGRFGIAMVDSGLLKLTSRDFASDDRPIDANCTCSVCKSHSRAYVHLALKSNGSIGPTLVTLHNVTYMLSLMSRLRKSILDNKFESFAIEFMQNYYKDEPEYPKWVMEALADAGITLRPKKHSSTLRQSLVAYARESYATSGVDTDVYIAPYSPSPESLVSAVIQKLELTSEDVLYDLGCGDGRWLFEAIEKTKVSKVVGIELNASLVAGIESRVTTTLSEDDRGRISVLSMDLWKADISNATVIIVYGFSNLNSLKNHIRAQSPKCRVVSVGFRIPNWNPVWTIELEKIKCYLFEYT